MCWMRPIPMRWEVTRTVKAACRELGLEYFRYTRRDGFSDVLSKQGKSGPDASNISGGRQFGGGPDF